MINKGEFRRAKELESRIYDLENILSRMQSPYVETTVGLVNVNSASQKKVDPSDEADAFHEYYPHIETELKKRCRVLIIHEKEKLESELRTLVAEDYTVNGRS